MLFYLVAQRRVTILFADFVDFMRFAENMQPRVLVDELNSYFTAFDEIVAQYGLEKLNTIGDAYMCEPDGEGDHELPDFRRPN